MDVAGFTRMPGPGWGGGYIGGQWAAGMRAPGGWGGYRRPHRGWQMPGYWRSPDYRIQNYAAFGLAGAAAGLWLVALLRRCGARRL